MLKCTLHREGEGGSEGSRAWWGRGMEKEREGGERGKGKRGSGGEREKASKKLSIQNSICISDSKFFAFRHGGHCEGRTP